MSIIRRLGRIAVFGAIAWLFIAFLLVTETWPPPHSKNSWILFLAFGPPVYLLAEAGAEWAWSSRAGRAISNHPSSALRIFTGVIIGTAFLGLIWLVSLWLRK